MPPCARRSRRNAGAKPWMRSCDARLNGIRQGGNLGDTAMSRIAAFVIALFGAGLWVAPALGHEVRPAYLELRPAGEHLWHVLWKAPALAQSLRLGVDPRLPENCTAIGPRSGGFISDAYIERWMVSRPDGLSGGRFVFEGLAALRTDVLLRIESGSGQGKLMARIQPESPEFVVPQATTIGNVIAPYLGLGAHHILAGADHLLFVLSLLLLVRDMRALLTTITAFTIGHSVTLAAAALGHLDLPGAPVEAAIALSICCTAAEAVRVRRSDPGIMSRSTWTVALVFGLLHGLGFAGALRETGLPEHAVPQALLFFNVGVEIGQLLFVGAVVALAWVVGRISRAGHGWGTPGSPLGRLELAACRAVGITGGFWVVDRVASMIFAT